MREKGEKLGWMDGWVYGCLLSMIASEICTRTDRMNGSI